MPLQLEDHFSKVLPGDIETENVPRQVLEAFHSPVKPRKPAEPRLLAYSPEVATLLGLDQKDCQSQWFVDLVSGAGQPPAQAYSMCYGGHQFGNWAGQLGDGRAINLGEVLSQNKRRYTLQLKGAGPTPYSRAGDGLAVLRSSVREFLCSEAMAHLGIKTTRALSLVTTGDQVLRDMFYNGNAAYEPGAIVCRVSESFIRFGNFEIMAARNNTALLKQLADFVIDNYYSHLGKPGKETYIAMFHEICQRTAHLVVDWLRVGFVHGVMNTDNMSILGETIDFGPYGWVEDYDPMFTPNTTDAGGRRYAFARQPEIAQWNLVQLGNALVSLVEDTAPLNQAIEGFAKTFSDSWQSMILAKLGLSPFTGKESDELVTGLLNLLAAIETDYTIFFRRLAEIDPAKAADDLADELKEAYYDPSAINEDYREQLAVWMLKYKKALDDQGKEPADRKKRMNQVNPWFIPRNYLVQVAIDRAEEGDTSEIEKLLELSRHPYTEQAEYSNYALKRPEWARHKPGCAMLSCSS